MLDIRVSVHKNAPKLVEKLPSWALNMFINMLKIIFHEKLFFKIYETNKHLSGLIFVRSMLESLNISYTLNGTELANIPSTGKLIVIANHPTGAVDTMVLVEMVANARENKKVKIVANGMLMGIHQVAPLLIPVDNIKGSITKESITMINNCLDNEEVVIVFPEGKVDRFTIRGIKDTVWKKSFLKIAKRTKTPILPLHIKGRNSILFYLASFVLPKRISGLLLPHEFATGGKRKPIHITVGKVIPYSSFEDSKTSIDAYSKMFFKHVYNLENTKDEIFKTETTIAIADSRQELKKEIDVAKFLGYSNSGHRVILAEAKSSPFIVRELGRIREISFREIGVGGSLDRNNDLYDAYYKHLVLWDDDDLEIIGAYRIGECKQIIEERGIEALYTSNLCYLNEHFSANADQSIELGRSFVQPKYWKTRAFDNLWQAITLYLAHHPHIRYSYGAVTINADFPKKATAALVYFYTHHFTCETEMMKAKEPYIMKQEDREEFDALFKTLSYKEGFVVLKKYLKNLGTDVPTLFKQYIALYEEGAVRYFDFSVSDLLHGLVGGFIIADNYKMNHVIQTRNLKAFNDLKKIDPLTKLYAREHFTELVSSVFNYKRKTDNTYTLVVFTLAYEYEEEISNKILIRATKMFKDSIRSDDIIGRWDNKSFIVMFTNMTEETNMKVCEKLCKNIGDMRVNVKCRTTCTYAIHDESYLPAVNNTNRTRLVS